MQFVKSDTDKICLELGGIEAFAVTEDAIWGALVSFNALIHISMDTWKVQFVDKFPEEDADGIRLFGGAVYYQGKAIFCPMSAKNIAVYDIEKGTFYSVPLDMDIVKNNKVYKKNYKTEDIVLYNDYAYIVGCSYPAIIRLSLQDMSVKYITEPFKELDRRIENYSSGYFACVIRQNNYLYAGCCLSGDILKFSLRDETYEIIRTDFKGINAVAEKENMVLLTSLTDQKGYKKKKDDSCFEQIAGLDNVLIAKVIDNVEAVYWFCFNDRKNGSLFWYDPVKDKTEVIIDIEEGFWNAVEFENKIYAICVTSGKIIEIDIKKRTMEEHILTYSGIILRHIMNGKEIMVVESKKKGLKEYLEWIVKMDEV